MTNEFENSRIGALEKEVEFYERQLKEREKEINELNALFKSKLEERRVI